MPYITKQNRKELITDEQIKYTHIQNCGELNYIFTKIIINYFERKGNYQAINDIVGALEGAKLEFYRKIAIPYENDKIKLNGDVMGETI